MLILDRIPRRLHSLLWYGGLVSAAHLALITAVGLAHRHGQVLHLDSLYLGRRFLPQSYHAGASLVRADVLVADVFSALLSSRGGGLILDLLAGFWAVVLAAALVILFLRRVRENSERHTDTPPQGPLSGRPSIVAPPARQRSAKVVELRRR